MKCDHVRLRVHDYLDQELLPEESLELNLHLGHCEACRTIFDEYGFIKEAISLKVELPQRSQEQMRAWIQHRAHRTLQTRLWEAWDFFRTFCRDLDRRLVWSKLSATPITLAFFFVIVAQFSHVDFYEWTHPVFGEPRQEATLLRKPIISQAHVRQQNTALEGLSNAVWRLPYEDSLSLVAKITPEGNAQIDSVLNAPKSLDLLNAIDLNLRESQFEMARTVGSPFLIYSFQKIDVYEYQRGL
ncbi:MAG: zf-HC2 domain-containing protein [Acidobacteriota bacterium]